MARSGELERRRKTQEVSSGVHGVTLTTGPQLLINVSSRVICSHCMVQYIQTSLLSDISFCPGQLVTFPAPDISCR